LKKAVLKLRDEITKDFNRECEDEGKVKIPEPVFIRHLNERLRGAKEERPKKQMVEVVFQKPDNAATLREAYNTLNKKWKADRTLPDYYKGIFIFPSHTQRTRIRIEILKALSKTINSTRSKEEGSSWVVAHLPRPVLKVSFGKETIPKTFTFPDAIRWSMGRYPLAEQDLLEAYRIAGNSFGESIENHFIVLKSRARSRSTERIQNKRPRKN